MRSALHLDSLRPLVRYVDDAQAVIDAHFQAAPSVLVSTKSMKSRKNFEGSPLSFPEFVERLTAASSTVRKRLEITSS